MRLAQRPRVAADYPFLHRWDPARYSPSYLRQGLLEEYVQATIVAHLRTRWRAVVSVIDVGDRRLRGRAAMLVRAAGGDPRHLTGAGGQMTRGIVDLAVTFRGGRAGWFEVKKPALYAPSKSTGRLVQRREAGTPTPEQLAFLDEQYRQGACVGVLWSERDLDAVVEAS